MMEKLKLGEEHCQSPLRKTICNDCAFYVLVEGVVQCTNPDKAGVNCSTVVFCSSFQPTQEVDSPCVSYGTNEE